jgi:predicted phosphodiesterase
MRYALLSDVHGKTERLRLALDDIRRRGAQRILSLGDVGSNDAYTLLREAGAVGVFGNWEVSGMGALRTEAHKFVSQLPAVWDESPFVAAHAVPYTISDLKGPIAVAHQMRKRKSSWGDLFPYMAKKPDTLWQSFTELADRGRHILFHGHTHVQSAWQLDEGSRPHRLSGPRIQVGTYNGSSPLFIIGVGSVGLPNDGSGIAYTWYDSTSGVVEWIRLPVT